MLTCWIERLRTRGVTSLLRSSFTLQHVARMSTLQGTTEPLLKKISEVDAAPLENEGKGKVSGGGGSRSGRGAIENADSLIGSDIIDDIIRSRPVREKVNLMSRSRKSWDERVSAMFHFLGKPLPLSPSSLPLTLDEMEALLASDNMEVCCHSFVFCYFSVNKTQN